MIKLGALFWLLLVVASGFATFKVKYAVQDIEDQLARTRKQAIAEQQEIRVLTAEWTFLNQPERLAELNQRFLGLVPLAAKQLQRGVDEIPLRPPPAAPDLLIAAVPGPATSQSPMPAMQPTSSIPTTIQAAGHEAVAAPAPGAPISAGDAAEPRTIRLVKAGLPEPNSLDALIARIAETR